MEKDKYNLRDMWDSETKKHLIVEGEKSDKGVGAKNIWRNNGQKLPKFNKKFNLHIPEIQCCPSRIHSKSSSPRHIVLKLLRVKDK